MANIIDNMDAIEEEIRELILHSKSKRRSVLNPCDEENLYKYLKGVEDEMSLYGVKYLFNPYEDLEEDRLKQTLVRVVNATWELLLLHKDVTNNGEKLKDRNYALQQNNFHINNIVDGMKRQCKGLQDKLTQVEEEKRQLIINSETNARSASKAGQDVKRYKSALVSREREMTVQLKKAEKENEQMRDRFHAGIFSTKVEARDSCIAAYRAKEKKYIESIAKLQENNRQLIREVLNLKDELLKDSALSDETISG